MKTTTPATRNPQPSDVIIYDKRGRAQILSRQQWDEILRIVYGDAK